MPGWRGRGGGGLWGGGPWSQEHKVPSSLEAGLSLLGPPPVRRQRSDFSLLRPRVRTQLPMPGPLAQGHGAHNGGPLSVRSSAPPASGNQPWRWGLLASPLLSLQVRE